MGIAEINEETSTITITANFYFYGDAANEDISFQVGEDMRKAWNIPDASVIVKGKKYQLLFDIKGMYAPHLHRVDVISNDDPQNNYFRIEEYAAGNISFVDGIGSNTGYLKLDNLLNGSTTAAHEFGHTLGLMHPADIDFRGKGVPGMMYPRGTITDPEFQYDPAAQPSSKGGTMNPFHRAVRQEDINDLHLEKLNYDENGRAVVGEFTSEWHYRHENGGIS